ncbi:ATP-binding protein [Altererythrobacter arenosus]|uniref:histidine kinase n=1 Tax=Altererythrobacter arenosus TaxID=3032592 RepID=A0ABY8G1B9_9SPHN|nr:ATP-binding protein [Altererythrobacter sp. CAU 1644]WFL78259.1 ATP-binding protein [Altererythrobacter sp. CAU 1644]
MNELKVEATESSDNFRKDRLALVYAALGGLAFSLLAYASIELTRGDGRIAAVWIPNAVALAFLLRVRVPREPLFLFALVVGNICANLAVGDPLPLALGLACANSIEIGVAVWLTRRLCGPRPVMENLDDLARLVFAAALVAPLLSAIPATLVLAKGEGAAFGVLVKWAATDGLGMAIITPALLIFHDAWINRRWPTRAEAVEWAALTTIGTSLTIAIFAQSQYPLLFAPAPIVLSHAFRLGPLGTAFSVIKMAAIASIFTSMGLGPINIIDHSKTNEIIVLQAFIASAFLIGLPVAAALSGRVRMLEQIENGRRELAVLADNITDAVLCYDLAGMCTYASPSVEEVLGEDVESFLGNRASDRAHPDARQQIVEVEQRLLTGESEKERFTYRRFLDDAEGNPVYIEADCAIARNIENGEVEGIIVSARDVTERVELEKLLVRARRHAENAAHAKSEFLANMSHEIRTPMNGVLGFAELLLQTPLEKEQRRHAELIVQSGRSMMLLLNDILDLSKIEAGQIVIDPQPVELEALLEECATIQRASAEKKGLKLTFAQAATPNWVLTDGLRLRQIVLNLVGNAVKFTEQGMISVGYELAEGQFTITVTDTGIGISADRIYRIFKPFEQGESDTARRYGGTGLGLSISRQLAELLGGYLDVASTPGKGTTFSLTLPLVEATAGPQPAAAPAPPQPAHLPRASHILLVEDHDVNRLLVKEMLQRCGQTVAIAHDGTEAVAAVLDAHMRGEPFDLVLMDIQMPGCDGYAATRAIRGEGIRPDTLPIIALTANAFPEDISAARDSGMQGHLAKPLVFAELVGALQRWLPTRIVEDGCETMSADGTGASERNGAHHSPALLERWRARRSEAIEAVGEALRNGRLTGCDGEELARLVHKLAGTAGMFGEDELGERAAAFERALRSEVDQLVREELARNLLEAA